MQINDEIHGKLTPRVIVHVNSGSSNRTVEEESYRRNRLKVSDTGYHSDRDWDGRSIKSYHSDGYLSDTSSYRNRPPVNDRTFVNANEKLGSQNKNGREGNGNQNGYRSERRRSIPSRENTQDGRRSKRRTSLGNGDTSGRFMIEEEENGNERSAEKSRAKKEVSWSDGRNKENNEKGTLEDKIADSNLTNQNQRVTPKIVTQPTSSEAVARPAKENPTQGPDHENEAQTFLTEDVNSGSNKSDYNVAKSSAVETRSKFGIESSFEKSEADTMISNANSGYQGDVSDIGLDEKTDYSKVPKNTSKVLQCENVQNVPTNITEYEQCQNSLLTVF